VTEFLKRAKSGEFGRMLMEGALLVKVALRALLDGYQAAFCGPVKLEVFGALRLSERKRILNALAEVTGLRLYQPGMRSL